MKLVRLFVSPAELLNALPQVVELRSWTRDIELTRETVRSCGRATQQCKNSRLFGERDKDRPIANHADAGKGKSQPRTQTLRQRQGEKRKKRERKKKNQKRK